MTIARWGTVHKWFFVMIFFQTFYFFDLIRNLLILFLIRLYLLIALIFLFPLILFILVVSDSFVKESVFRIKDLYQNYAFSIRRKFSSIFNYLFWKIINLNFWESCIEIYYLSFLILSIFYLKLGEKLHYLLFSF